MNPYVYADGLAHVQLLRTPQVVNAEHPPGAAHQALCGQIPTKCKSVGFLGDPGPKWGVPEWITCPECLRRYTVDIIGSAIAEEEAKVFPFETLPEGEVSPPDEVTVVSPSNALVRLLRGRK